MKQRIKGSRTFREGWWSMEVRKAGCHSCSCPGCRKAKLPALPARARAASPTSCAVNTWSKPALLFQSDSPAPGAPHPPGGSDDTLTFSTREGRCLL